ncbi:MAG TPA: hypothetical protein VK427_22580, partial [Kofleriaceae bacterium]|nr:hypothetical protein [Kofleriaceae bacterium]
MRFVTFVFGLIVGVGATLAYVVFFAAPPSATATGGVLAEAPITIALGEQFLTGVFQRSPIASPQGVNVPPRDLRVVLGNETLELHATIDVLGRPTGGRAVLRPELRDGRLHIEVTDSNLGTLPLGPLDRVLEEQINARLGALLAGMPVTFTGVTVDPARGLTLTCDVDLNRVAGAVP